MNVFNYCDLIPGLVSTIQTTFSHKLGSCEGPHVGELVLIFLTLELDLWKNLSNLLS